MLTDRAETLSIYANLFPRVPSLTPRHLRLRSLLMSDRAAAVPRPTGEAAITTKGQRARVVYDYAAEEENELDLTEGSIVEHIEQVDEGWWSGTSNGKSGLFPSNYVELLEDEQEPSQQQQQQQPPQEEVEEPEPEQLPPRGPSPPPAPAAPPAPPAPPVAPAAPPAPAPPPAPPAPPMPPREPTPEPEAAPAARPKARALYDYTADEDNELSELDSEA